MFVHDVQHGQKVNRCQTTLEQGGVAASWLVSIELDKPYGYIHTSTPPRDVTTLVFGWYSATRIRDNKTPTQSKEHIYANTAHGLACTTYSILVSVGSCDCPPIACTCDAVGLVSSDTAAGLVARAAGLVARLPPASSALLLLLVVLVAL